MILTAVNLLTPVMQINCEMTLAINNKCKVGKWIKSLRIVIFGEWLNSLIWGKIDGKNIGINGIANECE